VRFSHVPVDSFLRLIARLSTEKNLKRFERIARHVGSLLNPSRFTADEFRWLLSQGGEKEPRRVVEQFARWIRNDEMKRYRRGSALARPPDQQDLGPARTYRGRSPHATVRRCKSACLRSSRFRRRRGCQPERGGSSPCGRRATRKPRSSSSSAIGP